jgi:hypothetical protein
MSSAFREACYASRVPEADKFALPRCNKQQRHDLHCAKVRGGRSAAGFRLHRNGGPVVTATAQTKAAKPDRTKFTRLMIRHQARENNRPKTFRRQWIIVNARSICCDY